MRVGSWIIKTAVGSPLSVSLAQISGLLKFISAGILTILCIQPFKESEIK